MPEFRNLWDCLYHWASSTPHRIALRMGEKSLTYADFAATAEERARWLLAQGVTSGDRVPIVGYNSLEWIIAHMAVMRLGAISVPANNRCTPIQMARQIEILGARIALSDTAHRAIFDRSAIAVHPIESHAPTAAGALPVLPPDDAPALISFSSGTTGDPKGAVLGTRGLFEASNCFRKYFGTGPDDSTLILAPMFHNTGFVDQFGQMLIAGGEAALIPEFHRKEAVMAFKAAPATFVTAVPSVLRMLMLLDDADVIFAPARKILFGGSPMPPAWSREMLERWPHLDLVHGYGLTEFGSACSFLPPELISDCGASVGFAAPGAELRLVDENGEKVPAGAVGEIWAAGPTRMLGYWGCNGDISDQATSGRWLRTGDLGRFDEAGRLYLVGRRDDVINRGGEKILPSHLETLLSDRPDVANCAIVGVPDPVLLQVPVAVVEERRGHRFDPDAARAHLAANLPDYAVPRLYLVFEQLPRIASGKIDRRATRDLVIAQLDL